MFQFKVCMFNSQDCIPYTKFIVAEDISDAKSKAEHSWDYVVDVDPTPVWTYGVHVLGKPDHISGFGTEEECRKHYSPEYWRKKGYIPFLRNEYGEEVGDMTIRNLTPHAVTIVGEDGNVLRTFESEGIARASQTTAELGALDSIRLVRMEFGSPVGLPDPEEGVYLIVSLATANAAKQHGRSTSDLLLTADPVRDEQGRIIGCRALAVVD